ncbi:MAG: glycoside hydrolase family 2 TIM barrel-domain containing protein [Chloroflexota bacterium]|nr:glycoside hydrolase family 2 TIM barrel-domain containing protein [Chloroflexota bacterium]
MTDLPRPEYPRPQFVREDWLNLNGTWRFDYDDEDTGLARGWAKHAPLTQTITVPFAFQAPASGIGSNDFHDHVWYAREFTMPRAWRGRRILLHFGAVDYCASVWVNGEIVIIHEGGHTSFSADITPFLMEDSSLLNRIVVRAEDVAADRYQPRGKQYWERESASIFYTRTTGIWQTVWLEPVAQHGLRSVRMTPDIDAGAIACEYELLTPSENAVQVTAVVTLNGEAVGEWTHELAPGTRFHDATLILGARDQVRLWSPETPHLYDVNFTVRQDGHLIDSVRAYFGMRQIAIIDGRVCLNGAPYTMRLVLDQGYHPEGLLTFPTDAAYLDDIDLTKRLGFNGVRKHQKVEDPRYLFWADQIGLLVWGEMANAYAYSSSYVQDINSEWVEAVERDYNHPCIVAWVPMNESWGVPDLAHDPRQRAHLRALTHLTRSLDTSRLVISNDGWEHAETDLLTIHDYEGSGDVLRARYATVESTTTARPANRDLYVSGYGYDGAPILLTEFGGIAYRKDAAEGWGYTTAGDEADFLRRLDEVMRAVRESPVLQGWCYTQLTDVEQEINGVLTYDRKAKADIATLRGIFTGT